MQTYKKILIYLFNYKRKINEPKQIQTNIKINTNNINNENGSNGLNNNEKEYYRECLSGLVKSYAYYEDQNVRNRDYMEDKGKSILNFNSDQDNALFCLFDGHGGGEVSKFLQEYFHTYMKQLLPFNDYFENFVKLFKILELNSL